MTTTGITKSRRDLSRRAFLKASAGTAGNLLALQTNFSAGVHIAEAAGTRGRQGDPRLHRADGCLAAVIAKEKGFFAKHGMPDVEVAKQASWGATRDNLVLGCENERHRWRAHPDARCPT